MEFFGTKPDIYSFLMAVLRLKSLAFVCALVGACALPSSPVARLCRNEKPMLSPTRAFVFPSSSYTTDTASRRGLFHTICPRRCSTAASSLGGASHRCQRGKNLKGSVFSAAYPLFFLGHALPSIRAAGTLTHTTTYILTYRQTNIHSFT